MSQLASAAQPWLKMAWCRKRPAAKPLNCRVRQSRRSSVLASISPNSGRRALNPGRSSATACACVAPHAWRSAGVSATGCSWAIARSSAAACADSSTARSIGSGSWACASDQVRCGASSSRSSPGRTSRSATKPRPPTPSSSTSRTGPVYKGGASGQRLTLPEPCAARSGAGGGSGTSTPSKSATAAAAAASAAA